MRVNFVQTTVNVSVAVVDVTITGLVMIVVAKTKPIFASLLTTMKFVLGMENVRAINVFAILAKMKESTSAPIANKNRVKGNHVKSCENAWSAKLSKWVIYM